MTELPGKFSLLTAGVKPGRWTVVDQGREPSEIARFRSEAAARARYQRDKADPKCIRVVLFDPHRTPVAWFGMTDWGMASAERVEFPEPSHTSTHKRCFACGGNRFMPGSLCLTCDRTKARDLPSGYQFVTTSPDPTVRAFGPDAGQSGWRLHIIKALDTDTVASVRRHPALCGVRPAHGWCLDLFIDRPCAPCMRALMRAHPRTVSPTTL